MSRDSFTQTTHTSWFTRMSRSVGGIFIGIMLVLASFAGLFVNEGRAVKTARALTEGAGLVVSIDSYVADPANDGKLVHVAGKLEPHGTPSDDMFAVSAPGALRISRSVEMYQWKEEQRSETRNKVGGGTETVTTFTYVREWSARPIDSSAFREPSGHANPPMPVEASTVTVPQANLGAFVLSSSQLSSFGSDAEIPLPPEALAKARSTLSRYDLAAVANTIVSGSATAPQVGDLRISWKAAKAESASIIARQSANALVAYETSNGRKLFLTRNGIEQAATMFEQEQESNVSFTWLLRALGLGVMFAGFATMLSILGVIGDIIPFIGRMVRSGTSLIAMFMTAIFGPLAIALGWFAYRPLLAAAIIVTGLALAFGVSRLAGSGNKRSENQITT
ncbi:MAG: TMEM43 family protein [Rhizobiaceae bacterium]